MVSSERLPIERPAAPIMDRAPVTVPLQTGLKVIDALIPIGRGQRELILGDRQTGKTAIAIDTILNQRGQNVVCVYCAIGQRASAVAKAVANLREKGAMEYTVVVVTEGNDPPGLAYIAPYAATSIAEHFMEAGRDVLIVYDDLTQHARAYRELSLLLRRPPGREAFPGDIFYIHSRLLERATHLRKELGSGSLTALPIIETEAQNISAYIPTNLISITDGQIYLSPSLFELGVLPAVDVGKSVSRVGGKAQRAAYRAVAGDLKLAYAQFEELETFARFGARAGRRHPQDHRAWTANPRLPQAARVRSGLRARADCRAAGTDREALRPGTARPRWRRPSSAVQEAAASIPADVRARFDTAERLERRGSQDDRRHRARRRWRRFYPKPEAKPRRKPEAKPKPEGRPKAKANRSRGAVRGRAMSDTTASLRRKIDSAGELQSVVRTMKTLAASSIGQYEKSVRALADYYRAVELGWARAFERAGQRLRWRNGDRAEAGAVGAVVFGSDQGLVGQFNEVVADHAMEVLAACRQSRGLGRRRTRSCAPGGRGSVADGPLHRSELRQGHRSARRADSSRERNAPRPREITELYLFHNRPQPGRSTRPSASGCFPSTTHGDASWPSCRGRPSACPRSWVAPPRRCGRSSASISSSRSFGRAPNPSRARTRADWRRWSAPTRTSTSCWRSSMARSTACARAASTRSCSMSSPALRRFPPIGIKVDPRRSDRRILRGHGQFNLAGVFVGPEYRLRVTIAPPLLASAGNSSLHALRTCWLDRGIILHGLLENRGRDKYRKRTIADKPLNGIS